MVGLRQAAALAGRSDMPLATVSDLLLTRAGQLYVVTRSDGGFWLLDAGAAGAAPVLLGQAAYRSVAPMVGQAPVATILPMAGGGGLLLPAGMNGSPGSAYGLAADGSFGTYARWDSAAGLPADLALATAIDGATGPSLVGVRGDGSLLTGTLAEGRRLSVTSPAEALPQVGGAVSALDTLQLGGQTYLFTVSATGQSLVVYRLLEDLQLARTAWVGGHASGIGYADPAAVKAVMLEGQAYVIVAGSGSSSLSVFWLGPAGGLAATDHLIDSRDSRFQAVTQLETVTLGGQVFVLAAGADDGISLLTLLPGGQLLHLGALADSLTSGLGAISAIAARATAGGQGQIFVASGREAGLTQLILDILPGVIARGGAAATLTGSARDDLLMGDGAAVLIQGGAGDDILVSGGGSGAAQRLEGGAGADVFVIRPGTRLVTLADYTPGTDRLDLTLLPMLRSLSQLDATARQGGIYLRFGETVIEILTHDGRALSLADFDAASLLPVSRYSPLPPEPAPQGRLVVLGAGGEAGTGGEGDDTIRGGAGADTLRGHAGNDRIEAGEGNDNIGGGAGNDLIYGGNGANAIWGGLGDDTIEGGSGNDTIDGGGSGRNRLLGHDGNDVILAGAGGDFIGGGAGNDVIRGGDGSDTLYGGAGNDNIGGGAGGDLIYGSAGRNIIWGGWGDDTVEGAEGADTLLGGPGADRLAGAGGDDWLLGGDGADLLEGGAGHDALRGEEGADTLIGGAGNDSLGGGAGDDLLYGVSGANALWGGYGDDTIHPGVGRDVMNGGPGADSFVFASAEAIGLGAGRDVITDFTHGVDHIDLRALDTAYNGSAGLSGAGARSFFAFSRPGAVLLIGDQDGDGQPDWVIELSGAPALSLGDFLL